MEFSRQVYQSGLPFPSPGDLPDPRVRPTSPALQADSLPLSHQDPHLPPPPPSSRLGHRLCVGWAAATLQTRGQKSHLWIPNDVDEGLLLKLFHEKNKPFNHLRQYY